MKATQPAEQSARVSTEPRTDVVHGVCRTCSKRTLLFVPARICERCLLRTSEGLQMIAMQARTFGFDTELQRKAFKELCRGMVAVMSQ